MAALVVEHELGERAGELGLPHSGRAEEDERADRTVRVLQPRAGAPQRIGHGLDGLVLADDALVEALLHVDQLLGLALEQARDRNPGPAGDDLGDVVLVDLFLDHGLDLGRGALLELALELRQLAVADLRDPLEVAVPLGALGLHAQLVDLALDLADAVERLLLARPARAEAVAALLRLGQLALDRLAALLRLLAHRRELDLELAHAALGLVELERRGVDLHAQARTGLVDEVDRLVGKLAVRDVAVGEHGSGHERGVADAHAVVGLVALLQAAQDRDRVRNGRLADEDGLEAPLERRVLLDVLAVLVERRRADRAQLAAREHRLQQVRRVDRALGRARADDRVQLVDEEDDLALGVLDLLEDGLDPLLELAAVLRAGEQGADVERPHALALQALGHVAGDDPLGEALDDRGLPHSGLADQDRVVLRAAREHLDHAPDLLVAPDDRVELALLGELGQVAAELLERLVGALRVLGGDALAAADLLQAREQLVARDGVEREQQVLGRDELVLELAHLLLGAVEDARERGRGGRLLGRALERRPLAELRLGFRTELLGVRNELPRADPGRAARAAGARDRSRGCRAGARLPARRRSPPGS